MAGEGIVPDLLVERLLAMQVERAGDHPLDVLREAGKDPGMIGPPERVHVAIDRLLVFSHRQKG